MIRRLALAASLLAFAPGLAGASPLTAFGTATIDGLLNEWVGADSLDLTVNVPGGGTASATLFVMNDEANLYLALRIARDVVDAANSVAFEFDGNHNGVSDDGDDAVVYTAGLGFFDEFRTSAPPCPPNALCGLLDADHGGTNDGSGAFQHQGGFNVYELAHPLRSGDGAHDVMLNPGDTIGFFLDLRMITAPGVYPDDFGDTTFPAFGYAQLQVAQAVPEPSSFSLLGIAVLTWRRLRRGTRQL